MKAYVIDTHAWVWQMFLPHKLGKAAAHILTAADCGTARIHIPAVVLAEFLMIANKRRVAGLDPEMAAQAIQAVHAHRAYSFEPLTPEWVLSSQAHAAIPDIFDRLIVTEAAQRGIALITRDPVICGSGLVPTVWDR